MNRLLPEFSTVLGASSAPTQEKAANQSHAAPAFFDSPIQTRSTEAEISQATFDALQDGVMVLDTDLRILHINAAARARLGHLANDFFGTWCHEKFHLAGCPVAETICPARHALQTLQHEETELYEPATQEWLLVSADPIKDALGRVTHIVHTTRNINKQKAAEEALRRSFVEIEQLKDRLQAENDYLKAEITASATTGPILGETKEIKGVLELAAQVAPTGSSVLVEGETGTGKELIAELIHRLSPRKSLPMIRVNCAALPAALVESELFGREKGAYTGALTREPGRFELADRSTIFLDEIGELSLEVQAKLLRVLQEGTFERLGSSKPIRVDVRVIAATNRDLSEELRKSRFRQDLFYRLNVFPIKVPPLRERVGDIPLLTWGFIAELTARMGKRVTKIPRATMDSLQAHSWPGNVRELRNVLEHAVIISPGETLRMPPLAKLPLVRSNLTLAESEREHILQVLELTNWRIKGPHGAAKRLGLNASTLYSRMAKLCIPNRRQRDELA